MRTTSFRFTVPGTPVGKGRPRFVRATGRTYTPDKTARYENLVALAFRETFPSFQPLTEPLEVTMTAYFPIPDSWSNKRKNKAMAGDIVPAKKPDTDNIAKIKDALNGLAWNDDAQVVTETIRKLYSDIPRLEVEISVLYGKEK